MWNKCCIALLCWFAGISSFAQIEIKSGVANERSLKQYEKRESTSLKEVLERSGAMKVSSLAQQKNNYNVSLLLPFCGAATEGKIDAFLNARETGLKPQLISEEAKTAFDFYDGVLLALKDTQDSPLAINLHVFDTWNNDSVTKELLKQKSIQTSDIIIGPATNSNSS